MTMVTGSLTAPADPHLRRALQALDTATAGFAIDAWTTAPPGRWNSAQIVEHLGKAYGRTVYILEKCLADGLPKGRPGSWRQRLFTTLIVDVGYFPSGVQAPAMTVPEGLSGRDALASARQALIELDAATAQCAARFGPRVLVANHPLLGGFTVRQWRRFHWAHTRHHVKQIARLQA